MKKTFFAGASIAALIAAAPALALGNNESTVTQSGTNARATVNQTGANSNSEITQTIGGAVTVTQGGTTGSESDVTTSAHADPTPPAVDNRGGNTVEVKQSDSGVGGTAAGQANKSVVNQVTVNLGSSVLVEQSKTLAGAQNYSFVQQGNNASNGDVIVRQTGAANVSNYYSTTSTDNDATITQTGLDNDSFVQQDFQIGSAVATVSQIGSGGDVNQVIIQQIADGFADAPPSFGNNALASASQDGAGNFAAIYQSPSQSFTSELDSTEGDASSTQVGDNNVSGIGQFSSNGFARVAQRGTANDQLLNQFGTDNTAYVTQDNTGGGMGNRSGIAQYGDDAYAEVTQIGADNSSTIDQGGPGVNDGFNNRAFVEQYGNSHVSSVVQQGSNNTATVTQGTAPGGGGN